MAQRNQVWVMAAMAAALIAVPACSGNDSPASQPTGNSEPIASTTGGVATETPSAPPAAVDIEAAGARRIEIGGDWLSAGEGAIWLSGPTAIYRLDPATGKTAATIKVPDEPCEASDVGLGYVWTATCGVKGLVKLDPQTDRVVDRLSLRLPDIEGEGSIGVGANGVWVAIDGSKCGGCVVARVDPDQMEITARVPVRPGAAAVRFGAGYVWATHPDRDTVTQIDPVRLKVINTYRVGSGPRFFAVYAGSVWTLDQNTGTVTRIEIRSGETTSIAAEMAGSGGDLAAGGGWVWARGSGTLLKRIDPRTNEVVETYGPDSGSGAAIVGSGSVWLSAHDISVVWALPLSST